MKVFRYSLWAAIFLLGTFLAYSTFNWTLNGAKNPGQTVMGKADIGGDFTAQRTDGSAITHEDLKGRPHAIFFGFTNCPDICPTTLYEAGLWMEKLGDAAKNIDMYFVTVDPERDTPEVMTQYLSAFDKRIVGITGTNEQVAQIIKQWRVFAEKVALDDGDYTMNHVASVYLMNANGDFFGTISNGEDADTATKKLQRLASNEK